MGASLRFSDSGGFASKGGDLMPSYLSPGVYVEEVPSGSRPIEGAGTALAAFVGFTERGPSDEPVLVTNWTQFSTTFGGFAAGAYLPPAVYGYFLNGGGAAYIVRVGAGGAGDGPPAAADRDGEGAALAGQSHARAEVTGGQDAGPAFAVRAHTAGPAGNDLSVEIAAPPASAGSGDGTFTLVVKRAGKTEETFANLTMRRGPGHVATAVRKSKLITIENVSGEVEPATGTEVALTGGQAPHGSAAVTAGDHASAPVVTAEHYVGDVTARTGLGGLEAVEDVTMVCVPDLMSAYQAGALDADGVKAVQLAMIAHCELMADRVAILDTPPGLNAQQVRQWRMETAGYDSKYAALYWPWLQVMDPDRGHPVMLPPSGHVAGVWARNDDTRGVHKAPANEVLRGVIDLQAGLTKGEHGQLNPAGVNCIRAFPGQGIRIWGARTLSSDPQWRYLNVRRLFNFVEKSVLAGTNWVVFEPNDRFLWMSVERVITTFLRRVWRSGALFGRTPEEAFYVKCDEENNPPENRDAGILTVDVGIAPVKPAEFVVFRIAQYSEGAGLEE
jgi:Bacteriophage tail sheath protein